MNVFPVPIARNSKIRFFPSTISIPWPVCSRRIKSSVQPREWRSWSISFALVSASLKAISHWFPEICSIHSVLECIIQQTRPRGYGPLSYLDGHAEGLDILRRCSGLAERVMAVGGKVFEVLQSRAGYVSWL